MSHARKEETSYARIVREVVKTAGESALVFDNLNVIRESIKPFGECFDAIRAEMRTRFKDRYDRMISFAEEAGTKAGKTGLQLKDIVETDLRTGISKASEVVYVRGVKRPEPSVPRRDED
ncbi:MAG: hypothetical protein ACHQX1_00730 [Candidatus Micrarchaeales archaeon]